LKEEGNKFLKLGLYKSAIKKYSEALDLRKDILPLYSNWALARNKIEDFQGSYDDCTRLLEYCEVFEDGFLKSRDLCFKALSWRAVASWGLRNYELALKDLI